MFCIISDSNIKQMSVLAFRPLSNYLRNIQIRNPLQLFRQAERRNFLIFRILQKPILKPLMSQRNLFTSTPAFEEINASAENDVDEENEDVDSEEEFIQRYLDPKDRSRVIAPETSIKYLGRKTHFQIINLTFNKLFRKCGI